MSTSSTEESSGNQRTRLRCPAALSDVALAPAGRAQAGTPLAKNRHPPGPHAWPFIGNILSFAANPIEFGQQLAEEHGDLVRLTGAGMEFLLLFHPDDIERVLVKEHAKFVKDQFTHGLSDVLGQGLLLSEGDFWRRQRRLAQPAFHHERIQRYAAIMVERTRALSAKWRPGEVRDLRGDLMRLTLDIVTRCLFSADVGPAADTMGQALDVVMTTYLGVLDTGLRFPSAWPTPANLRLRRAVRQIDGVVRPVVAARLRASQAEEPKGDVGASEGAKRPARLDLLDMLLSARDDDGGRMSETQLRDEVVTLMLAGHETTALTLAFIFHALGQHPSVHARLVAEVDAVLGGREATFADLARLPYTDAVVHESMRVYPPAWIVGRENTEPFEVGGYTIPPRTQFQIMTYALHRDPRWFDDPAVFRPERWLGGDLAKRLPRFAYFPFGGGPRVCIGNLFAKMEAALVLATLLQSHSFQLASPEPLPLVPSITLRPSRAIRATLHARRPRPFPVPEGAR